MCDCVENPRLPKWKSETSREGELISLSATFKITFQIRGCQMGFLLDVACLREIFGVTNEILKEGRKGQFTCSSFIIRRLMI